MDRASQAQELPEVKKRTLFKKKSVAGVRVLQRKGEYRLYPNATQLSELEAHRAIHCRLYNTVLADRINAYKENGKSLSFCDQAKHLTGWRKQSVGLAVLNAQSEQNTLRRVDLAYKAFFRKALALT
jgi:putative transposase